MAEQEDVSFVACSDTPYSSSIINGFIGSKDLFHHLLRKNYVVPLKNEEIDLVILNESGSKIIDYYYLLGKSSISVVFARDKDYVYMSLYNHTNKKTQMLHFLTSEINTLWNSTPRNNKLVVDICVRMENAIKDILRGIIIYDYFMKDLVEWAKTCISGLQTAHPQINRVYSSNHQDQSAIESNGTSPQEPQELTFDQIISNLDFFKTQSANNNKQKYTQYTPLLDYIKEKILRQKQ